MPTVADKRDLSFGNRPSLSPKEFMREKKPQKDIERVACLAYYLTHYRETPSFKTADISKLNTEAAQIKFSNAAFAVINATNAGYLASAGVGKKQLSSLGEEFVDALPDYERARAVAKSHRRPKLRRKSKEKSK